MLELTNVRKTYQMGTHQVHALAGVSLTIEEGDFVAIMGPSGSGKSTLLSILGLLDVPTAGSYRLDRREVSHLSEDDLADLRRETVGFIFQQFNLLPRLSALENVALPLLYTPRQDETKRPLELLEKVGLSAWSLHKPNELSGGQQQRVAIARSLVNQPKVILADEPTGNLDSGSSKEILAMLKTLNTQGITVILVTHEEEIGSQANRLIHMQDGLICSDKRLAPVKQPIRPAAVTPLVPHYRFWEIFEYFKQGFKTLAANKIRTGLSMLGILIGVGAVVAMLAIGSGARRSIELQLSSLGSNLLLLRPGAIRISGMAMEMGLASRLTLDDVRSLREHIPSIKVASANVLGRGQVTYQDKNWTTQILGTTPSYQQMRSANPSPGRFFTDAENQSRARVAILGATVVRELFGAQNPIGEIIKINKVSFQVIGLLPEKGATGWRDQDDTVILPVSTAMYRLLGRTFLDHIEMEIDSIEAMEAAEKRALELMYARHRVPLSQRQTAFDIRNMADIQAAMTETSRTMSVLLSSIAAISLLVGGIGIMNIMLVSVTERTREIGLRKAIGAKRWDILAQFLAEAIVVSTVGGVIGIFVGWLITTILNLLADWPSHISLGSVILAFTFSAGVGILFGFYPARKASLLPPLDALRYE